MRKGIMKNTLRIASIILAAATVLFLGIFVGALIGHAFFGTERAIYTCALLGTGVGFWNALLIIDAKV